MSTDGAVFQVFIPINISYLPNPRSCLFFNGSNPNKRSLDWSDFKNHKKTEICSFKTLKTKIFYDSTHFLLFSLSTS